MEPAKQLGIEDCRGFRWSGFANWNRQAEARWRAVQPPAHGFTKEQSLAV